MLVCAHTRHGENRLARARFSRSHPHAPSVVTLLGYCVCTEIIGNAARHTSAATLANERPADTLIHVILIKNERICIKMPIEYSLFAYYFEQFLCFLKEM